jgi:hypothetical protein
MKNKFFLVAILSTILFSISFGQSTFSGYVFNDLNNDSLYEPGEGISNIKVWLFDLNAVAPRYRVVPIDSVVTSASGLYTFSGIVAGNYQVRVMIASMPATITREVVDPDSYPNGLTNVTANGSSVYANINFGYANTAIAPVFTSGRTFKWNANDSFVNTYAQTYPLTSEICGGTTFNPTITWTTDRIITPGAAAGYGASTYPEANSAAAAAPMGGQNWPGNLKGGINTLDSTFVLINGGSAYTTVNNDRLTITIQFSNPVINVKFSIYDIDHADPQVATGRIDHVNVTGYDLSNPVNPVILSPSAVPWNTVSGNNICGFADYPVWNYSTAYNSGNEDHGTVNVYFQQRIETIVIQYEEWAPVLIVGEGINDASIPANAPNESSWSPRSGATAPTFRGISFGSINYTFDCADIILPVSLENFEAVQNGCNSNLEWETSYEQNLDYFGIEHSSDGVNFQVVGSVQAKNIISGSDYQYSISSSGGVDFYRLKMAGKSGSSQLSNIVSISPCNNKNITWNIVPNPINLGNDFTVTISSGQNNAQQGSLIIFDSNGKKIFQKNTNIGPGDNPVTLNTSMMASGIYLIRLLDANNNAIGDPQKIIVK